VIIITILDNLDKKHTREMPFVKIASCRLKALHQWVWDIAVMTNEASRWDKLNAISHFKAHLKYRETTARETVANDREKCALKW